jgi:hypothetical protein
VKSWTNVLDKRKIMSLPGDVYKVWDLLCRMAGRYDNDGILPPLDDCAYVFHKDAAWMQAHFDDLCKRRLLDKIGNEYRMHDWEEWQLPGKPSDAPERIRERVTKHREKQRAAMQLDDVTPSNALRNAVTTEETRREEKRREKKPTVATPPQASHRAMFAALSESFGKPTPGVEQGRYNAAAKALVTAGADPAEIPHLCEAWGWINPGPPRVNSLAGSLTVLRQTTGPRASPNGNGAYNTPADKRLQRIKDEKDDVIATLREMEARKHGTGNVLPRNRLDGGALAADGDERNESRVVDIAGRHHG